MKSILVVDDEKLVQRMYRQLFEKAGYEVRLAADGQEALCAMAESRPDILLSDLNMPRMDGLELLKRLRETAAFPPVAILLSGHITEATEREALAQGVALILGKPIAMKVLLEEVNRLTADL